MNLRVRHRPSTVAQAREHRRRKLEDDLARAISAARSDPEERQRVHDILTEIAELYVPSSARRGAA
jgi:hypothetical protein